MPSTGVHAFLAEAARAHPGAEFLKTPGETLSYGEAWVRVRRLASWMRGAGLERGGRVVILSQNRPEVALGVFATSLAGGIFSVLNSQLKPAGVAKILEQSEPSLILVDEACAALVEGLAPGAARLLVEGAAEGEGMAAWEEAMEAPLWEGTWPCVDVDPASLVFTSGSTGTPRGVTLSHANILFVVGAIQQRLNYRSEDVVGCFLPLAFDYGLYQVFLCAQAGAALLVGDPGMVGPRLPKILAEEKVTVLPGVPAIYAALIKLHARRPVELPDLRAVTNTGERLPPSYIEQLRAMVPGLAVYVMFGLTECKRVSIMLPEELERKGDSVGRALDGTEVYAVDEAGELLGPGEEGELVVRGRHVAHGYWRAPEETAVRFRKRAPESPVELFTGDRGAVDADGFIYFGARADDLIKHRGNRMSPVEIENEACAVPGVVEAAVLQRVQDDSLHLFVTVSGAEVEGTEILCALSERLEPAKVPDVVHLEAELPKSVNGKIDRKALKARLEECE